VMLDQERCILCSRCVRFTEEISRTYELGVFERGSHSVIDLVPGKILDNPYSGNVIDICPVGALTETDFRFQCRVWYLTEHDSICPGCSRGCNISIHYNKRRTHKAGGRRVMRIKPRYHPEINEWWICDRGRFGYLFIDENRIEQPFSREEDELKATDWDEALAKATGLLAEAHKGSGIGVLLSPGQTNEEMDKARDLFLEKLNVKDFSFSDPWEKPGLEDDLLMKADCNPNTRGAMDLNLEGNTNDLLNKAAAEKLDLLVIFNHHLESPESRELLDKTKAVIFIGSNWNETAKQSDIVLPSAVYAEKDGSFTNFEGRRQEFRQAFLPLGESRDQLDILEELSGRIKEWNS